MVIDLAYFAKDEKMRNELLKASEIRHKTLDRCYAVEGYIDFPTEKKNNLYDNIKAEIEKEIDLKGRTYPP